MAEAEGLARTRAARSIERKARSVPVSSPRSGTFVAGALTGMHSLREHMM
jgi:hypothetical protein